MGYDDHDDATKKDSGILAPVARIIRVGPHRRSYLCVYINYIVESLSAALA